MVDNIKYFVFIFGSIFLEALPFILIGSLMSSIMQVYVREELLEKIIPKNKIVGGMIAGVIGFFMPICECATVPMSRALMKKGVSTNVAVTYMLAAPIINPVVLLSTYYAFNGSIKVMVLRAILGYFFAVLIGYLVMILQGNESPFKKNEGYYVAKCSCGCSGYYASDKTILTLLNHTSKEFYDIGRYFVFGAAGAALFQIAISKEYILKISSNGVIAIIVMMIFAYLVSLCSEADAFIASTFLGNFGLGPVVAFLILGPMIDLKNTLMMMGIYKKSFIFKLIFCIFSLCFLAGCLLV